MFKNSYYTRKAVMKRFVFVFVLLLMLCADVFAVTISGTVKDSNGNDVEGAFVTFTDETDPTNYFTGYTDETGKYEISFDPDGPVFVYDEKPVRFKLHQNYPNPFNPSTTIPFSLETAGHVNLTVYNIMGQAVKTLVDDYTSSGMHTVTWDGTDNNDDGAATGIYLYRLTYGEFS